MYAFLLVLGAVATAAGVALIASGVPINEFALGNTLIVAGTVSAVGGLIIIALGLAVRELQRIERALVSRPMPRPARPIEPSAVAAPAAATAPIPAPAPAPIAAPTPAPEKAPAAARIPFPQRPKPEGRQPAAEPNGTTTPSPAAAEETAFERLRHKFPSLTRIDSAPVVEANEVSLSPKTPARPEEYAVDAKAPPAPGHPPGHSNGAAPVQGTAPPAKTAMFDSLWPKDARGGRQVAAEPQHGVEASAVATAPQVAEHTPRPADVQQVSILKSGVVDGMAYTLYSDGSIEAQLPQGTMRFGSITELRNHLERNG
jgi:hypothetical protein